MEVLMYELDNKSSVNMGVKPSFDNNPEDEVETGHAYSVMGYNEEDKAVKLYDPSVIAEDCVSSKNLPSSFTATADPNKGEFWITIDQLENRSVDITALQTKSMYQSYHKSKIKTNW